MQGFYDYKKFAILYVDDEEKSLKFFTRAFEDHFRIFTATNAEDGFRIFQEKKDEIGVLVTDQRMPGEKGVQLLEKARALRPRVIRIMATAFADIDAAVDAVNTGAIYKYVTKPWDVAQLEATLRRGLEFFIVQRERDQLLKEKLSVIHNMMITDRVICLGILAAGLNHHLRNSLVAVRTFIDLAPSKLVEENVDLEELRNPNFWREFYSHVQGQVKRITDLLTELGIASESPGGPGFKDEPSLTQLVNRTVENLKLSLQDRKITVQNQIPADLPRIHGDERKLDWLFQLLIKNQVFNLPEGSTVTLKASQVADSGSGPQIQVVMEDDGPGFPKEALRPVFDPFFIRAANPQEFGIHLMTCYLIVYHHGGRIEVRNRDPHGAIFTMTFPLTPQTESRSQEERDFLGKVFMNDVLWEKLLAGN
ncbi:MAG: hybrid sensor histidine kinase/response regulator [Verrucomicrobiota bacterium]